MCRDMYAEITQRIRSGWKAFTKIKDVLKAKLNNTLGANFFNSTVLLAMLYTNKTWATMEKEEQKLVTTQKAMEKSILEISLSKQIQSDLIQE